MTLKERIIELLRSVAELWQNSLVTKYREMSHDLHREREAMEWIEALIGDAFTPM